MDIVFMFYQSRSRLITLKRIMIYTYFIEDYATLTPELLKLAEQQFNSIIITAKLTLTFCCVELFILALRNI